MTDAEIEDSVESYGSKLVMPPEEEFSNFEVVEIKDTFPKLWDVRFFLWAIEEGKSELMIVLAVEEFSEKEYVIRLKDILVP